MTDLTLYHNGPSTCSQKVRLILGLKNLPYHSKIIDLQSGEQHTSDYIKINPNHVVPTLLFKGNPIIESSLILEFLEDKFPEISARPIDPESLHKTRLWLKTTDAYQIHGGSITYGIAVRNILCILLCFLKMKKVAVRNICVFYIIIFLNITFEKLYLGYSM